MSYTEYEMRIKDLEDENEELRKQSEILKEIIEAQRKEIGEWKSSADSFIAIINSTEDRLKEIEENKK